MERQTAINYFKSKGLKHIIPVSLTVGANDKNPIDLHDKGKAFWGNIIISFGEGPNVNTTAKRPGKVQFSLVLDGNAEILQVSFSPNGNYESYYIAFDKIEFNAEGTLTDTFITFQGLQFS